MKSRRSKPKSKSRKKRVYTDPRLDNVTLATDEPQVGRYGEVFAISDNSGQCPVSGGSYYIFLDQAKGNVTFLHPFSLTKFSMDLTAFRAGVGSNGWNPTPAKLAEFLSKKIKLQRDLNRLVENYLVLLQKHYAELAESSIS
jgi:hypothetical protein